MTSCFAQFSSRRVLKKRGFTIVELLVVIAIIGALLSILTPALIGVRRTAKKTREKSNIRQVGVGWSLYSNSNLDGLLPGWLDTDVQSDDPGIGSSWAVSYNFPDKHKVPPSPTYSPSDENIAGPWPWRLMSYLDYNHELVHGYLEEESTGSMDYSDPEVLVDARDVALHPAFGYNAYYIGGWWKIASNLGRPVPMFRDAEDPDMSSPTNPAYVPVVALKSSHIKDPTKMIIFCSSAPGRQMSSDPSLQVAFEIDDDDFGSHYVVPPFLAQTEIYGQLLIDHTNLEILPGFTHGVPVARYNNQAAILRADLSVDAQTPGSLVDMRFWVNGAKGKLWQHTNSSDIFSP